jgi:hypothetical protein
MFVLFVSVQFNGSLTDFPPVQLMTVAPLIVRSLLLGKEIAEDHEADPAGTVMVSPDVAAFTQSRTSVRDALAAMRFGLDPLHAASASFPVAT